MDVITTHINADFDAFASMVAAKKLYPDALIAFSGSSEKGLRDYFVASALYALDITPATEIDLKQISRLIIVDSRQQDRIGVFNAVLDNDDVEIIIYDHHPPSPDDIQTEHAFIARTGACTTLMTEIMREKELSLTPDEATILMLGIYEDTGSLSFVSTTSRDFHAAAYLLDQGASLSVVSDLLIKEMTTEQVLLLHDLIQTATRYRIHETDVTIATAFSDQYIGDLAVVAHKLRDLGNYNVLFVLASMEDRVYLVARSRLDNVHVGDIARKFGGGGHPSAASATLKEITLAEAGEMLIRVLHEMIPPKLIAGTIMSSPAIIAHEETLIRVAQTIMTRYNINGLVVVNDREKIVGILSRQTVEKAIYHGLEQNTVSQLMTPEFHTAGPGDSFETVQQLVIGENQRLLPVVEKGRIAGVITRTDVMRIFRERVGEKVQEGVLPTLAHPARQKQIKKLMVERLPAHVYEFLKKAGEVAKASGVQVYGVGGFVRDLLLRRDNFDIDIVVEGDGMDFAEKLAVSTHGISKRHRKFKTAAITLPEGFSVDIASARLEYYDRPAALPTVSHSSIKLDLYRRDFTINTLAVRLDPGSFGELLDFFGAQEDLREKRLRVLNNLSFVEDPTRILRAIRFEQRFGFRLGKHTLNLMKHAIQSGFIDLLSGKRFFNEFALILGEEDPVVVLKRMDELGVLKAIHPKLVVTDRIINTLRAARESLAWYDLLFQRQKADRWVVYLFALTDYMHTQVLDQVMERFKIPLNNRQKWLEERKEGMIRLGQLRRKVKTAECPPSCVYEKLNPLHLNTLIFMMAKADSIETKKALSAFVTDYSKTKIFLKGNDLQGLGIPQGPVYQKIFHHLLMLSLDGKVTGKKDEISWVVKHYRNGELKGTVIDRRKR